METAQTPRATRSDRRLSLSIILKAARTIGTVRSSAASKMALAALLLIGLCCHAVQGTTSDSCPGGGEGGSCAAIEKDKSEQEKCRIYLSQSSVRNAGFGVFAAVDFAEGDLVGFPDVSIQLVDLLENNPELGDDLSEWAPLLGTHSWDKWSGGGAWEAKVGDVRSIMPHVATLFNYHTKLNNAREQPPKVDSSGVHRSRDPGAGAFTYFSKVEVKATKNIAAGTEIFSSYYDDSNMDPGTPVLENYEAADNAIHAVKTYLAKTNESITRDLWEMVRDVAYSNLTREVLPSTIENDADLDHIWRVGSARNALDRPERSKKWLAENGLCIDSLYGAKSTISGAGQGAFTSRSFAAGETVVSTPLVHIPNREFLRMRKLVVDPDTMTKTPVDDEITSYQLLLNYCFGNADSPLLLFPYVGLTTLVNHNNEPNMKIQWSTFKHHQSEWLEQPAESLSTMNQTGLFIDYIATKDIAAGDEVFIDYGSQWEEAWREHVLHWSPPEGSSTYVPAYALNANSHEPVRTAAEREQNPYPENVMLTCRYCYHGYQEEIEYTYDEIVSETLREPIVWNNESDFSCERPCTVLWRETNSTTAHDAYTAAMLNGPNGYSIPKSEMPYLVSNIPREAIRFVDIPGSTDQHLPGAFRQSMEFPKELWPKAW